MRRFPAIILAVLMAACSGGTPREQSALWLTVPSRSVAMMHFGSCTQALEMLLDSSSVFRRIDYGRLAGNEMILSYDYGAALVPMLSLDAGRASEDTSAAVSNILAQAEKLGIHAYYTAGMLPRRAAVLLSTSPQSIEDALTHIRAGVSVLDVKDFGKVLQLNEGDAGCIILRNQSASRWLPKGFLKEVYPRRSVVEFISAFADWTVLSFKDTAPSGVEVSFFDGGAARCLSNLFSNLDPGTCRIGGAVPENADFVLALPLKNAESYISSWKECLDSRASLAKYKGRIAGLKRSTGKNPENWILERKAREVAMVRWDGHEALLMRCGTRPSSVPAGENPYQGFIPALFGEAFRIKDDSVCATSGDWTVFGSAADVQAWEEAEKQTGFQAPNPARFYLKCKELSIGSNGKKTILNVF